jgi:hypothetical protein
MMTRLLALCFLLAATAVLSAADDGPKSTSTQKSQCDALISKRQDVNGLRDGDRGYAYVRALIDEMDGELTWADSSAHTMLVKGTWQDGVTTDQLILVFVKYVNDNPAELNKPAREVFRRCAEGAGL